MVPVSPCCRMNNTSLGVRHRRQSARDTAEVLNVRHSLFGERPAKVARRKDTVREPKILAVLTHLCFRTHRGLPREKH